MKELPEKKNIVFALLLLTQLFINDKCYAQEWLKVFNTYTKWCTPYNLKETYDHGILIQYDFRKYEGAYIQAAVFKTDINGNKLWEKIFGDPSEYMVSIQGMSLTPDGGVIICGNTTVEDEYSDPFVLKLNACMQSEWCNIYHTQDWADGGTKIQYVPWDNTFVWELYNTMYDNDEQREFVMKLDFSGYQLWYNLYATNPAYCSETLQDLNLSEVDSSFVLNGPVWAYNNSSGWWELKPYWIKVADNGDFIWESFGIQHPDSEFGLSRYSAILRSGNIVSFVSDAPETYHVLLNKQGEEIFSGALYRPDSILSGSNSNATEIYKDSLIIIGLQYYFAPTDPCCSVIQITDTLGNLKNEIVLPVNFDALTTDFEITFDNKILAVTTYDPLGKNIMLTKYNENFEYDSIYNRPFTYDSLCPGGITSGSIDLGCSVITGIKDEIKDGPAKLTLAPNPTIDYTVVYLPETIAGNEKHGPFDVIAVRSDYVRNLKMEVFDLNGKQVSSFAWPDGVKEQVLTTGSWPTGLYLIRISNPERTIATGKLLINKQI